jgi:hypothetical protein
VDASISALSVMNLPNFSPISPYLSDVVKIPGCRVFPQRWWPVDLRSEQILIPGLLKIN